MQPILRSKPVRGVLGFAAGLVAWIVLAPYYNSTVASFSEMLIRSCERKSVTVLDPAGEDVVLNRTDFDPRSSRPQLKVSELTFNFVILVTLFAISGQLLTAAQIPRSLLALLSLFAVHVGALATRVMSIYALRLGRWSVANYNSFEANLWGTLDHFYRFVGMYALAFAIWWWLKPREADLAGAPPKSRGWKKGKKGA